MLRAVAAGKGGSLDRPVEGNSLQQKSGCKGVPDTLRQVQSAKSRGRMVGLPGKGWGTSCKKLKPQNAGLRLCARDALKYVHKVYKGSVYKIHKRQYAPGRQIAAACKKAGVSVLYLQSGSRRRPLPELRGNFAGVLIGEHGLTLAGAARHLGVAISAVALMLKRA